MSYKQKYIKKVESSHLEKLQTTHNLQQNVSISNSSPITINHQINYFFAQRKDNLLNQRWDAKSLESELIKNVSSASLAQRKKRKLKLFSPSKQLYQTSRNCKVPANFMTHSGHHKIAHKMAMNLLIRSLHTEPKQPIEQNASPNKIIFTYRDQASNIDMEGIEDRYLIAAQHNQCASKPNFLPVKSRHLYLSHFKGDSLENAKKTSKRQKFIIEDNTTSLMNPQLNKTITTRSKSKDKHTAPWAYDLSQRLHDNRKRAGKPSFTHKACQKRKRQQFQNMIGQSMLSKMVSGPEIQQLFQQLKGEPIPFWRSNLVNYYYSKLKRMHQYQKLSNNIMQK